MDWHEGEHKIHKLTRVPNMDNPTTPGLPARMAQRVSLSPTIAIGTTDSEGQVWCTIWGGDVPIAQQVARGGIMGIRTQVDASYDPVVQALFGGESDGEPVRHDPESGKMVSGLSIHLEERDRVKLFGKMLAGSLNTNDSEAENTDQTTGNLGKTGNAQLVLQITQSLGNCPKYLNKKHISSHHSKPRLLSDLPILSEEAITHVHQADVFFVSSIGPEDMDCNHRGGPPGFMRHYTENNHSILVWPEYSGNNLYQTLGNLTLDSRAGIVIPNMLTGTTLYVTGRADILLDKAASDILSKTRLAVKFTVTGARFVADSLQFRGQPSKDNKDVSSSKPTIDREITDGMSPYNPRVRYLNSEITESKISGLPPDEYRDGLGEQYDMSATLVKKTKLTSTITRYRFRLSGTDISKGSPPLWTPGQYVALDFSHELYMGYSHMNDSDPGALNDDFIRTFTVASSWKEGAEVEFEVVVRNVGSVTRWLSWQNDRGMTSVGVKGFAGSFRFADPGSKVNVFIAAGIGITPLLGQIGSGDERLIVVWTLSVKDLGLAKDVLGNLTGAVRKNVRLFVTGVNDENVGQVEELEMIGGDEQAVVERRRMKKEDLTGIEDGGQQVANWYLCTAPAMRKQVQTWLDGKVVEFENFDY